jgi:eukaryotic-like serine/threonine-protein kinase
VRPLGKGGMGSIWEGRHTALDRRVAVKFMLTELTASEQARRRFEREARAAGAVESEHVVSAFDFGVTEVGEYFLVLEYLEGEDLASLLVREGKLAVPRAVEIVRQALRGIERAHARGVVHRDLKPSNLFLTRREDGSESCKVLDFGVAKLTLSKSGPTRTGEVIGTIDYMPPEQLRGDSDIDVRADVYSLGCVLYECLSGERPFHADEPHVLMYRILEGRREPLDARVPPELANIVQRALDPDATRRYQTVAQFRAALGEFVPAVSASPRHTPADAITSASAPASALSAIPKRRAQPFRAPSVWLALLALSAAGSLLARNQLSISDPPAPSISVAVQPAEAEPVPVQVASAVEGAHQPAAVAEPSVLTVVPVSPASASSAPLAARNPSAVSVPAQRPRRPASEAAKVPAASPKPAASKTNAHGNFDLDSDPYQ